MLDTLCHITNFQERDIDLLLAEELRVNAKFAKWFTQQVAPNIPIDTTAYRTRVSVVEDGSEADVVACFHRADGGVHRIFIEDKITAQLMPEQLERYQRRALGERTRGVNDSSTVVLFAPASYHAPLPDGVIRMSFEEAAAALEHDNHDTRACYKASFLRAARPIQSVAKRDQRTAEVEPYVAEWWNAVYDMCEREFPGYFLTPKTMYPRSVYFAPRAANMANYIRVDFKGHVGEVDLAFKNIAYADLANAVAGLTLPGKLVQNGKSTAIRIDGLSKFVIADGFDVIDTHVLAAFEKTKVLLTFWNENRTLFDKL